LKVHVHYFREVPPLFVHQILVRDGIVREHEVKIYVAMPDGLVFRMMVVVRPDVISVPVATNLNVQVPIQFEPGYCFGKTGEST
jgi:hypothetical protein